MALIKKSNDLIQAKYQLTKNEQRLILHLLSTIQRIDKEFQDYEFSFVDLVEIMNIDKKTVYYELKTIAQSLLSNPICFQEEAGVLDYYNWCSRFRIDDNKKTVSLSFHPGMKPYLLQLKKNFTTYHLKYISGFRSAHAFRVYELCKQYQKVGRRKISLIEFKEILGLENKYDQIGALKAYVINPSIEDINNNSDLYISYMNTKTKKEEYVKYIKERRKIVGIEFFITDKLSKCKNEKQEPQMIKDVNAEFKTRKEQQQKQQKSADRQVAWNAMSEEEKTKKYPGGSGYIKFMSEFSDKEKS